MRPGPPPKPPELRLIQGNPAHRPIRKAARRPSPGASCPVSLSPLARMEWRRLLPQLMRLGLLTRIDRGALASFCEAWADLTWASTTIQKEGYIVLAGNGTQIPHPAVAIKHRAMDRIRKFASEFGFTPASRARPMDSGPDDTEDHESSRFFDPPPPGTRPPSRPGPRRR